MSDSEGDWGLLMQGVRQGDNAACEKFWNQYGPLLERVARKHLSSAMQRRVGPESVMISACRTFFRRVQQGEFDLPDAESLWRLLCAITVNKVRMKSRFHLSKKRGLNAEVHPEKIPDVAASTPSPAEEVEFAEQLEWLVSQFGEEEQRVLELKLQQRTNEEIAETCECSERTIRRLMKRIEARLGAMLDEQ